MLWRSIKSNATFQGANHHDRGFTIVELLVVVIVIAILASITVIAYGGVKGRAADTAVQSDLKAASDKFHTIALIENGGKFPSGGTVSVAPNSYTKLEVNKKSFLTDANTNNLIYCATTDNTSFGMAALSKSGKAFMYTVDGGIKPYPASWTSLSDDVCPVLVGTGGHTFSWAYGKTDGWKTWATETPGF